jgi:CubicO group peptidase (beta-lactamase class C family)
MSSSTGVVHTVQGSCTPRFERVREEFERNFAQRGEVGASVCVVVDGEPVVDLWGGVADQDSGRPWESETMNVIFSCSKGVTAICGNMVVDRGLLDLDAPIARYWPEFAQKGKAEIPVRMAFNHQTGVFHVSGEVPEGGFNDWELMIRLIEQTEPYWVPGTQVGYHGLTIGWLVGELVRRVTGKSVGTFLREEVTGPLGGLDCWIGLPEEHESRVATTIPFDFASLDLPPHMLERLSDPDAYMNKFLANGGGWLPDGADTREAHAAEIPAGGAIANARGLAGVYAPLSLDGSLGGVRLVGNAALARMRYPQSTVGVDVVIGARTCYTLGFSKSWPNPTVPGSSVIIGEDAFGTPGLGGQMGFADPSYRLAFGYTMTKHGMGTGLNERGQSLIDATYEILGSAGCEPGFWERPR